MERFLGGAATGHRGAWQAVQQPPWDLRPAPDSATRNSKFTRRSFAFCACSSVCHGPVTEVALIRDALEVSRANCILQVHGHDTRKKSGTFGAGRNISQERFFPGIVGRGSELIDFAAEERADTARSARLHKKGTGGRVGQRRGLVAQQKRPW